MPQVCQGAGSITYILPMHDYILKIPIASDCFGYATSLSRCRREEG